MTTGESLGGQAALMAQLSCHYLYGNDPIESYFKAGRVLYGANCNFYCLIGILEHLGDDHVLIMYRFCPKKTLFFWDV